MAFAQAARRPIPGAVATVGVSDRVAFLRRTYAHLGVALIAFALITAGMMRYMPETSLKLSGLGGGSAMGMLLVLGLFVVVSIGAQRLAQSETSRALQYVGLGLITVVWSVLVQPMIWYALIRLGNQSAFIGADGSIHAYISPLAATTILEATILTIEIFTGLTLTVFLTKKDFSFMGGALRLAMFAVIGVAIVAIIFGFQLGVLYSGVIVLLMAGYILYETSLVMSYFRPTQHVAAALMLFTTIVTLFIHLLRIMTEMNRRN